MWLNTERERERERERETAEAAPGTQTEGRDNEALLLPSLLFFSALALLLLSLVHRPS